MGITGGFKFPNDGAGVEPPKEYASRGSIRFVRFGSVRPGGARGAGEMEKKGL